MNAAKSLKQIAEELISSFPPADSRARSISTQVRNYVAALTIPVPPPEEEPVRVLDMTINPPAHEPTITALRPIDPNGRLPSLPANRRKAREVAGFTLQEVAKAAGTTVTTAKIYEEHRSSIRRNDKRLALDNVYRMFIPEAAP